MSGSMAENNPVFLNVEASESEKARIAREESTWTGRRLAALCAVSLGASLVLLYLMANWKSETHFPAFLLP